MQRSVKQKPEARFRSNRSQWCIGSRRTILLEKRKSDRYTADAEDNRDVNRNLYSRSKTIDSDVVDTIDGKDANTCAEEDGCLFIEVA